MKHLMNSVDMSGLLDMVQVIVLHACDYLSHWNF